MEKMNENYVFALDIGTRSIIGMTGELRDERLCITAIEKEEHSGRAMVDGQIEDIKQVAKVAASVKKKLEDKVGVELNKVHVAAAGRALKTQRVMFETELPQTQIITEDIIRTLESEAIEKAEQAFEETQDEAKERDFYLVGYTVCKYELDRYPISSLLNHRGRQLAADIIATFLPGEVVESLYTAMQEAGMEVAGMTLEPIASMNAAIPQKLRLLNLALVDIGAGTSDIAIARDGSICGYTMATVAGDEITESLMKTYLVDFTTAEELKMNMGKTESLKYTDVLGMEYTVSSKELEATIEESTQMLCRKIAERIEEVNGGVPSAVFLVGGGSKLEKAREYIAEYLKMDLNRVALGGNNFSVSAYSDEYDIKDPEYSTPIGIAVSAALNLINDSYSVLLNGQRAKLFRSGRLTIRDVLMMNGYGYKHIISRSGQSLVVDIDGKRKILHGGYAVPAALTLNGETAVISDVVKAGDSICFVPAKRGEDAKATLSQLVKLEDKGFVIWKDESIPLGITALVNGNTADADTEIKTGDHIITNSIVTVGDLMERYEIAENVAVNGMAVGSDWVLEDGDVLEQASLNAKPVITKKTEEPLKEKTNDLEVPSEGDDSKPAEPLTLETAKLSETVRFSVNGKTVVLNRREGGVPYFVMDMLSHIDLDLENPQGFLMIKVNGIEGGFQDELKSGDAVDIYWKE